MTISPTIDHDLMLLLNGDMGSVMDTFMWYCSSKLAVVPFVLYALFVVYRRYGWKQLLLVMCIIGLLILVADQTCNLFKDNLSRLRPTHTAALEGMIHIVNDYRGGQFGTVSAHAACSFSVLGFCALLVSNRIYTTILVIVCLLIVYSRIYLGVHFPLDIMWGTILGCFVAFIGAEVFKNLSRRIEKR